MTFSLKGLKTITNYQYEPACGILSLLDILNIRRNLENCEMIHLNNVLRGISLSTTIGLNSTQGLGFHFVYISSVYLLVSNVTQTLHKNSATICICKLNGLRNCELLLFKTLQKCQEERIKMYN